VELHVLRRRIESDVVWVVTAPQRMFFQLLRILCKTRINALAGRSQGMQVIQIKMI
jgi:hypothetical protein